MDQSTQTGGVVVTHRLAGRIDTSTSPAVEAEIKAKLAAGSTRILLDMREVTYVSSAGLRVVLLVAKQAKAAGGNLALFGLQPSVREVFDISGFGKIIPIAASEAEARALIGA
ncbi:MAG: STAS domain-containing protein [Acetobacteraceae bacterium]|nr:STAS domain-containing protein [Acetobacteraceae bacterium]